MVYSDQMAKNEQLNFYVNYEGKFGKHSIAAMAAVEKMQAYMHSKRMLFNNPDPDGYLGTSPSAGAMDTGNSITYKYKQGSLSYLGRVSYNYADMYSYSVAMLPLNLLRPIIGASSRVFPWGG